MKISTRKHGLDLESPPHEGEVVYSDVQVSRIVHFIVRRLRTFARVGMVLAAMMAASTAVVVAGLAVASRDTNRAVDRIIEQRTEARQNACLSEVLFAEAHNNLVNFFLNIPPSKPPTPESEALRQRFADENLVPVRDCSPDGIEAYYTGTN